MEANLLRVEERPGHHIVSGTWPEAVGAAGDELPRFHTLVDDARCRRDDGGVAVGLAGVSAGSEPR